MAIFKRGDMLHGDVWNSVAVNYIPANSTVNADGKLIMGRGLGRQVSLRYQGISRILGTVISAKSGTYRMVIHKKRPYLVYTTPYKIITSFLTPASVGALGLFQIKEFFADSASLDIIEMSTNALRIFAEQNSDKRFNLSYPGIGYGRLKKSEVYPIVADLPDNVTVWEYGV